MNNIKTYIQEKLYHQQVDEKLIIRKDSKLAKKSANTFGEFVNVVNDTIDINLKIEDVLYISKHTNSKNLDKMPFVEITDDKDESNYVNIILQNQDSKNFLKYYTIKKNNKGYVFNYINIRIKDPAEFENFRIGFIEGTDYRNINKVRIFKIEQ